LPCVEEAYKNQKCRIYFYKDRDFVCYSPWDI
jgi:hypothetical protein